MSRVTVEIEVGRDFLEDVQRRTAGCPTEIVILAPRPGVRVLLHTKSFYPEGTYRLPTGKMKPGEAPDDAFFREFREEMGFEGKIDRLLGVIRHRFVCDDDTFDFTSYVYLARESRTTPKSGDPGEEITGFIEVPISELPSVREQLRGLPGRWQDWGQFRAVAHDFAAEALG